MSTPLTLKQESFVRHYIESGMPSEAYRHAYDAENMTPKSISVEAQKLLGTPSIALAVSLLRESVNDEFKVSVLHKKTLLLKVAEYGLDEEVTSNGDDDGDKVQLRQINPQGTIQAVKELNAMEGDHANIKMKHVTDDGAGNDAPIGIDLSLLSEAALKEIEKQLTS